MALTGHQGSELEGITCDVLDVTVMSRDEAGQQAIDTHGLETEIAQNYTSRIPEDCPLTMSPGVRELANFAVCTQCSHSSLVYLHSATISRNNLALY